MKHILLKSEVWSVADSSLWFTDMAQLPVFLRRQKCYKLRRCAASEHYKSLYRFTEENVQWIASHFLEETQERRGGALSSEMKMKIFLRYMADPGFQSGIAEEMGIHQTTVSKTVISVSKKIMEKANIWIKFPSSLQDITAAKAEWLQKFNFPSAIGVIDCTHVRIPKPTQHGDEYVNRKGFTSINVQATCNAKECFTSVVASWPGSVHDCRIWKNSSVRDVLSGFKNTVLLGDEGYGLEPWLMTPYRNAVQNSHKNFNRLLKKERVIIERCFGQLKRRFPILQYVCRVAASNVPTIIVCCFVLHNVAKYLHDDDFTDDTQDLNEDDSDGEQEECTTEREILMRGREKREQIATLIENEL